MMNLNEIDSQGKVPFLIYCVAPFLLGKLILIDRRRLTERVAAQTETKYGFELIDL